MSMHATFIAGAIKDVMSFNEKVVSISADFVGDEVMKVIATHDKSFAKDAHPIAWFAALQHCKQMARAFLRHSYDPDRDDDQGEIAFSEKLQDRYPTKPKLDPWSGTRSSTYTLRDELSAEDMWFNIDRLRKSASARTEHSNALEAEAIKKHGPRPARAA